MACLMSVEIVATPSREADGPRWVVQFMRYGAIGFLSVLVLTVVVVALGHTVLPAFDPALDTATRASNLALCNAAGFLIANAAAYLGNRRYVFIPGRHSPWVEFGLFTAVSAAGFAAGLFAGPLMVRLYGLDSWLAQVLTVVSSGTCNFLMRKYFIFKG